MTALVPQTVDQAIDAVLSNDFVLPHGNRTKETLIAASESCCLIDTRGLTGITEYEPTEFTFTAKAGTPISEITAALDANGQWMPFDPVFSSAFPDTSNVEVNTKKHQSATLAGSISSGLNGSCSLRFGGARDFVLGIKFIDGNGSHITSGGKVVKNAAGFDLSKFFVGGCGRFGILTELTMKVFPKSEGYSTLSFEGSLNDHLNSIKRINSTPLEIEALDIFEENLWVQIGGGKQTLATAKKRIEELVGVAANQRKFDGNVSEEGFWQESNRFGWLPDGDVLFKVPAHIRQLPEMLETIESITSRFRVSLGGQVVYFGVKPEQASDLLSSLSNQGFVAQAIRDSPSVMPPFPWTPFARKIKMALDPQHRFGTPE